MNGIFPTSGKQTLRQEIKQRKQHLSLSKRRDYSLQIVQTVEKLEAFRLAKSVLSYCALPDEVDVDYLVRKYVYYKQFYFPRISGDKMEIVLYRGALFMQKGKFGILEPVGNSSGEQVDVVITPGIGFDRNGNRLGRGKGYYDRFLAHSTAYKTGIAFHCQLLDAIPVCENDIAMDAVITEQETLSFKNNTL